MGGKINQRYLYLCGVIAPLLFVFMTILGGVLRPGYSHISDTVSELFSPGSPNKLLLDSLHIIFTLLLILFGIGVLRFVRRNKQDSRIGMIGAGLYIVMGILSVTTATIFPQDAWGSSPTFAGEMHKILSGVIGVLSILSFLLIGCWFKRDGILRGFWVYSLITVVLVILSTGVYVANMGGPYMGLTERITILLGFQWTFILAFWMSSRTRLTGSRS